MELFESFKQLVYYFRNNITILVSSMFVITSVKLIANEKYISYS